jgi:hypothetical protein
MRRNPFDRKMNRGSGPSLFFQSQIKFIAGRHGSGFTIDSRNYPRTIHNIASAACSPDFGLQVEIIRESLLSLQSEIQNLQSKMGRAHHRSTIAELSKKKAKAAAWAAAWEGECNSHFGLGILDFGLGVELSLGSLFI